MGFPKSKASNRCHFCKNQIVKERSRPTDRRPPAGLPLWLWLERRIGWRHDDRMPEWREIVFVLVTWTIAAELVAPRMFPQATGDAWDALAYAGGAVVAGLLWQRTTRSRRA